MSIVPSPKEIEEAKTDLGGWTREQLAEWGVPWPPPPGWRLAFRFEHEHGIIGERTTRFLLDGLDVDDLRELKEIVERG